MHLIAAIAACSLVCAGCVSVDAGLERVESGNFVLDPAHAFLTVSVTHFGISDYRIDLTQFDAQLDFDPDTPTRSRVSLQIDPMALETHYPDPEKKADWERDLSTDGRFLDGERFSQISFVSTAAEQTGPNTGRLTGDLNLRGVTRPVTLDVTYNGTATSPLDGGRRRIGFTVTGTFDRTAFGMDALTQFVSEEVRISFSGEFLSVG